MDYCIGSTGTYIHDHGFSHLMAIPQTAAVALVKEFCPDVVMGISTKAKDLTCDGNNDTDAACNGWLNKLFIIISQEHDRWIALNNHDGRFSICMKEVK